MQAWRIDTLDARGGLAFTSWREEDLLDDDVLEEAPVFHIGAPGFAPVPVANRGIALAAERHGFQLGLFDKDGEVPFETLGDVADFVRRLYLASARRDTEEEGGAPMLAPVPHEGGPPGGAAAEVDQWFETRAVAVTADLTIEVENFLSLSDDLDRGQAKEFKWPGRRGDDTYIPPAAFNPDHWVLARGATVILVELLDRFPEGDDPVALERWRRAAETYVAVITRLGLVEFLADISELQNFCEHFIHNIWKPRFGSVGEPLQDDAHRRSLIVMAQQGYRPAEARVSGPGLEPLSELAYLPLPANLSKTIGADPRRASVADFLSVALAAPSTLEQHPDAEAVLVFAASRVVAVDGAEFLAPRSILARPTQWDQLTFGHRLNMLLKAGREWLADNLPSRVFYPALERMIDQAEATATLPHPTDPSGQKSEAHHFEHADDVVEAENEATAFGDFAAEASSRREQQKPAQAPSLRVAGQS
jgi:hypothetical protein